MGEVDLNRGIDILNWCILVAAAHDPALEPRLMHARIYPAVGFRNNTRLITITIMINAPALGRLGPRQRAPAPQGRPAEAEHAHSKGEKRGAW